MSPQSILVTGGAGFIGSNLVEFLLTETDVNVFVLDSFTYAGREENLAKHLHNRRFRLLRGDVTDRNTVACVLNRYPYPFDGILNLAAESHVDRSITDPSTFLRTNVEGTLVLLDEACKAGVPRFLQVSTDEVYGSLSPAEHPFTEAYPLEPNSPYSASKASADLLVRSFHRTYDMDTVTTRCSNNYGPRQHPEKLIPMIIHHAVLEEKIPVYGDGANIRDWIYVEDHCRGIWDAFNKGKSGEIYNFGGDCEKMNLDVVRTVLRIMGKSEDLIEFVKDRPGHDRRYAVDFSKARRILGWSPRVQFEEGIQATVDWYLNRK